MKSLKKQLKRWFEKNFSYVREDKNLWVIKSKSRLGCLLLLPLFLIFIGYAIFLFFKIYPIIYSTLLTRLGIAQNLGIPLLIVCFVGSFINLPLFILKSKQESTQPLRHKSFLPLFMRFHQPLSQTKYKYNSCIYLNVSGGLIPIVLAVYQFYRVRPSAILIVTIITSLLSYFLAVVRPGRGITIQSLKLQLIATVAALLAMAIVNGGENRFDVSVAFAGGVLGTIIGVDLLHLKDVHTKKAVGVFSIGGAGFNDAIVKSGLYALILTEWLPVITVWLSARFQ